MSDRDTVMRKQITTAEELQQAVQHLEKRRQLLEEKLEEGFHDIVEGLKPANILRSTLHEVQQSTDLKHNLIKMVLGLGAGYLSGRLVAGKSAGLLKKAVGAALQYGITNFVAKKKDLQDNGDGYTKKRSLLRRILSV